MPTDRVVLWSLRALWATLPLTAGGAAASVLDGWASAPATVAAVLLWLAWAVGLLGVIVPRPETLTALRAVAPAFAVLAVVAAFDSDVSGADAALAIAITVLASALASNPAVATAALNATAYGDERRYPLRIPPALFFGPLPIARLVVVVAPALGPLLVADGRLALGIAAIVIGLPVAALAARALHGLSGRFVVLVPAGVVVVDRFNLSDPVLFVREHVLALRPAPGTAAPGSVLDLRLGATSGGVALAFDEDADLMRTGRGRQPSTLVRAHEVWVAVVRRDPFLREAAQRRLRVTA